VAVKGTSGQGKKKLTVCLRLMQKPLTRSLPRSSAENGWGELSKARRRHGDCGA